MKDVEIEDRMGRIREFAKQRRAHELGNALISDIGVNAVNWKEGGTRSGRWEDYGGGGGDEDDDDW